MEYKILDISDYTLQDIITIIKTDFMYNQNNTIFILNDGKFVRRINYEMFSNIYPNITDDFFHQQDEFGDKFSYSYELNSEKNLKNIFPNEDYNPKSNFFMDKNRWDILYKNNNDVINFINKQNIKHIITTGDFGEYIYYYIKKYGTDIDVIFIPNDQFSEIPDKYRDYVVIDANNESSLLRSKMIVDNYYYSLLNFCDLVEIDLFNTNFLQKHQENFIFVKTSLDLFKYNNLSDSEQERCRKPFKKPYRYKDYLKDNSDESRNLVKQFYGDFYNESLIDDVCYPSQLMIVNGLLKQKDMNNPNFHIVNGKRITQGESQNNNIDINFFGTCLVYGQMVSDQCTIPSYFNHILDDDNKFSVHNFGMPTNSLTEIIRTINKKGIKNNSLNLIFYLDSEENLYNKLSVKKQIEITDVINASFVNNTVIDNILHCNPIVNKNISEYLYTQIKNKLIDISQLSDDEIKIYSTKDLYTNNKYVEKNIHFLEEYRKEGNNGAIVLHGNPFTKGHYELVKYASENVDTLYVFVLQEDRGIIKFEDRLQMASKTCEDFDNVVVLPSGEFLGSRMLFAEYGNKVIDEDLTVDCLDDTEYFCQIVADILNIKKRFIGEEEYDMVTNHLNQELKTILPLYNIECVEVPRFKAEGRRISAHTVRDLIKSGNLDELHVFLPDPVIDIIYEKNYHEIIMQQNNQYEKQKRLEK